MSASCVVGFVYVRFNNVCCVLAYRLTHTHSIYIYVCVCGVVFLQVYISIYSLVVFVCPSCCLCEHNEGKGRYNYIHTPNQLPACLCGCCLFIWEGWCCFLGGSGGEGGSVKWGRGELDGCQIVQRRETSLEFARNIPNRYILFIYISAMYIFIVCICIYKCTYIYIELYAKYYNNKRKNVDQVVMKMKKTTLLII